MKCLGYHYELTKKVYFVDAHKKPETIMVRATFVMKYLQYELHMHRWVQFTLAEATEKKYTVECRGKGYMYVHNGVNYVEYHVNNHKDFIQMFLNKP